MSISLYLCFFCHSAFCDLFPFRCLHPTPLNTLITTFPNMAFLVQSHWILKRWDTLTFVNSTTESDSLKKLATVSQLSRCHCNYIIFKQSFWDFSLSCNLFVCSFVCSFAHCFIYSFLPFSSSSLLLISLLPSLLPSFSPSFLHFFLHSSFYSFVRLLIH